MFGVLTCDRSFRLIVSHRWSSVRMKTTFGRSAATATANVVTSSHAAKIAGRMSQAPSQMQAAIRSAYRTRVRRNRQPFAVARLGE